MKISILVEAKHKADIWNNQGIIESLGIKILEVEEA